MDGIDERFVSERAAEIEARLSKASRGASPRGWLRRVGRALDRGRQAIVRKALEIVREHWDIAVFDVAFGCAKAFGVYPALYFAGAAWAIALAEYGPLNTQLWTAIYVFGRRQILSGLGRLRHGHSLNRLDAYRDELLAVAPRDARRIHRFTHDGLEWTLRIRASRARALWRRLRGRASEPEVVTPAELRLWVAEPEFLHRANALRSNPYLYEAVLLRRILGTPPARDALLRRLRPRVPRSSSERALAHTLGESLAASRARITEQGDALADALAKRLGSGFSAASLALRWLSWSHQRAIAAKLDVLERLRYALLAELLEGRPFAHCEGRARVATQQNLVDAHIAYAGRLCERAMCVASKSDARALAARALDEADALGATARLARTAYALSGFGATASRRPGPARRRTR